MKYEKMIRVAVTAAFKSSEILRFHLGNISRVEKKSAIDLVTEADKKSEARIIETIKFHFPDHSILAEESGLQEHSAKNLWIIDPLDGTTNYTHQLGLFAISIAYAENKEVVAGVVLNPVSGELFTAGKGFGARLNNRSISISDTPSVSESLLVTGFPYQIQDDIKHILSRFSNCLQASQGVRRLGSAALDLCYLACGRFDGFWEQNLKPWDTAAGMLIAEEAGAKITDFGNRRYTIENKEILATNGRIHEQMIQLMNVRNDE